MFSVDVTERSGVRVVTVSGDVDMATAPKLSDAVPGEGGPLVLDLAGVPFMSSAGVGVVSSLSRRFELVVAGAQPDVAMLLEVTGLAAHIDTAPDADAALAQLSA